MHDSSARGRGGWYPWYVVAVLTLFSVSGNIDQQILSLLIRPLERDFHLTDSQFGYLGGVAFALFFAVLGLPIARLADRTSRRNVMVGGATLWSLFTSLCAGARTFGQLFVLRMGVGVGEATLNAPAASLLADYFPRDKFAGAMSVLSLGIFIGSGAGYAIGGYMVGATANAATVDVPILGSIHAWQLVFLAVGLPGLLIALLLLTVREPRRPRDGEQPSGSFGALMAHVGKHRRTFFTQGVGFAMSSSVNFSLVVWIPAVFLRRFNWNEAQAGRLQGLLTIFIGPIGVLVGGWIANRLVRAGKTDAPLRVGMIGAAGMLVAATAFPLAPTGMAAGWWLAVVNLFAAMPWGAASASAAEIVPRHLRTQGVAFYVLLVALIARSLGPSSVGWLNDYVFHDPLAVGRSLAIVNVAGMTIAILLFAAGLGAFRRTLAELDAAESHGLSQTPRATAAARG
ncbi:MAG TPA: MFS transporter [Gemmatimonadaceae bacterium]|jgi:MFS family permease|nr:MFS transporter [Gemmatimonadaceae bacterium]